jgi:hypothetical protein
MTEPGGPMLPKVFHALFARIGAHAAYGALHRAGAGSVQGFLAIARRATSTRFRTIQICPNDFPAALR